MYTIRFARLSVVLLVLGLAGCGTLRTDDGSPSGTPSLHESHPLVFELGSYDFDSAVPLVERIEPMPDFVITYLEDVDARAYSRYTPNVEELALIDSYFKELPPRIARVMQNRVVGIYFMEEDFIGGGMTQFVLSEQGDPYVILIFNARTLHLSLSEWITYRENTAFRRTTATERDSNVVIRAECGSTYRGFMHILLHEGTHVVDLVDGVTPYLQASLEPYGWRGERADDSFTRGVWRSFARPKHRYDFFHRRRITFYGLYDGPHLDAARAARVYRDLANTPFVSLYAATSATEDLAELVTWYHLVEHLGQDNRIIIEAGKTELRDIEFMPDPSTAERRRIIESFYR